MLPFAGLALATLAFGVLVAALAGAVDREGEGVPSSGRKVFHVGIFTGAVPAHLFFGFWGVAVFGAVVSALVLFALWRGPGNHLFEVLSRREDGEESREGIVLPFASTALGGLSAALLVGNLATVGYLVCGWGDAAGEAVGRRWGRHSLPAFLSRGESGVRSVEGSFGVLLAGSIGAGAAMALVGIPALQLVPIAIACGTLGALAEALSGSGTDNFWVQLGPSLLAWWLLG
jgi:dolichol kinase